MNSFPNTLQGNETLDEEARCVIFGDAEDEEFQQHGGEFKQLRTDGTHFSIIYYLRWIQRFKHNAVSYKNNATEVAEEVQQAIGVDNGSNDLIAMQRAIHECMAITARANVHIENVYICAKWIQKIRLDPKYKALFADETYAANVVEAILKKKCYLNNLEITSQTRNKVTSIMESMRSVRAAFAAKAVEEANACLEQAEHLFENANTGFDTISALEDVLTALYRDVSEPFALFFALFMDGKHGCDEDDCDEDGCDERELVTMKNAKATVEGIIEKVEAFFNEVTEYSDCDEASDSKKRKRVTQAPTPSSTHLRTTNP